MRLARDDGATNPCGPLPHVFADASDDPVFDSSMFHDRENPWRLDPVPSLILRVNLLPQLGAVQPGGFFLSASESTSLTVD
jgi:hypothetical protein